MRYFTEAMMELVRSQSQQAELKGGLSGEILELIYGERLFKLFVPDRMNGRMTSLPDAVRLFEEASYIDGSFGWLVTIGSGGGYFSAVFDPEVASRLFSPADVVIAGSGYVGGVARRVGDGYQVSGSWRYCSGADFATIFTANCLLKDGTVRSFIFSPDQVNIIKDWDACGMKATGSHTISVQDIYVPDEMTFDISNGRRNDDAPIFAYPFLPFAEASFAAVNIGVCRHFIEEGRALTAVYRKTSDAPSMQRYQRVCSIIDEQEQTLNSVVDRFYDTLQISWSLTESRHIVPDALYTEVGRAARQAVTASLICAQAIYPYLGLAAAMEHTAINRCWRDLHTASQHVLLKAF